VYVVGDSLTVGTEPWLRPDLRRRGWTLTGVSARVGRPVSEGLAVLRAHRTRLPRTIVIALGTNDLGAGRQTVRGWLRTARAILGHRRIVWVNLCLASAADPRLAAYRQLNASLDAYAPRFGVVVAHWCSYATARGIRPGPDGIHYPPGGYRSRAAFYARAIATTR
jgi:lysophospholipase L1-like esterase